MSLSDLAKALATVERTAQQSPLDYYQWLPCQYEFLKSTEKRLLLRAGNQFAGKTTAGVAELIYRLMGKHPYKWVNPGPINALVVCASHEQTLNIQSRINAMIDDSLLHERCRFDVGTGKYYGKYPTVRLKNGSSCQFRSGSGDTLNHPRRHGFTQKPANVYCAATVTSGSRSRLSMLMLSGSGLLSSLGR